eukprot:5830767-Karenia_brevis.AAC.1
MPNKATQEDAFLLLSGLRDAVQQLSGGKPFHLLLGGDFNTHFSQEVPDILGHGGVSATHSCTRDMHMKRSAEVASFWSDMELVAIS